MTIEEALENFLFVASGTIIDGIAGFVPLSLVVRELAFRGTIKEKGQRGKITPRQYQYVRSLVFNYKDKFEVKIKDGEIYVRLR